MKIEARELRNREDEDCGNAEVLLVPHVRLACDNGRAQFRLRPSCTYPVYNSGCMILVSRAEGQLPGSVQEETLLARW